MSVLNGKPMHPISCLIFQPRPKLQANRLPGRHCYGAIPLAGIKTSLYWEIHWTLIHCKSSPCRDRPSRRPPVVSAQTYCLMKITRSSSNALTHKRIFGMLAMLTFHWTVMGTSKVDPTPHPLHTGPWAPTPCYHAKNTKRAMPNMWAIIRPFIDPNQN